MEMNMSILVDSINSPREQKIGYAVREKVKN